MQIEEDEEDDVYNERFPPRGEEGDGYILNGGGGGESAEVHGGEAGASDDGTYPFLCICTVPGHVHLLAALEAPGLQCVGGENVEGLDHPAAGVEASQVLSCASLLLTVLRLLTSTRILSCSRWAG